MVVGRFGEIKLAEYLTDVRFDGSLRDDEALGEYVRRLRALTCSVSSLEYVRTPARTG